MSELEFPAWPEYPGLGSWIPTEMLANVLAELPGLADVVGWLRAVPDPQEPLPAVHLQLVWISDGCVRFATVSGCTVATASPDHDAPKLVGVRYAPLEQLTVVAAGWPSATWPPP